MSHIKVWDIPRLLHTKREQIKEHYPAIDTTHCVEPEAPHGEHHAASFWELFYDLVFVVAVGKLAHTLVHVVEHDSDLKLWGLEGFSAEILSFFVHGTLFYSVWISEIMYTTRFEGGDDIFGRLLNFGVMYGVCGMAENVDNTEFELAKFAQGMCFSRIFHCLRITRGLFHNPGEARYLLGVMAVVDLGLVFYFMIPAFFITDRDVTYYMFAGFIVFIHLVIGFRSKERTEKFPYSNTHFPERLGILTILNLGESIIACTSVGTFFGLTELGLSTFAGMIIVFCIWWLYFDNITGNVVYHHVTTLLVLHAHANLMVAIVALGAGLHVALVEVKGGGDILSDRAKWLFCGVLVMTLFYQGIIGLIMIRRIEKDNNLYSRRRLLARMAFKLVFDLLFVWWVFLDWKPSHLLYSTAALLSIRVVYDTMIHVYLDYRISAQHFQRDFRESLMHNNHADQNENVDVGSPRTRAHAHAPRTRSSSQAGTGNLRSYALRTRTNSVASSDGHI